LRQEFRELPGISFLELDVVLGTAQRFRQEQTALPKLARRVRADVLISAGNFALRKSPVPQVLLSRNALYTCPDFYRDLVRRREYALWLESRVRGNLARRSIFWAECTVAPTEAFAEQLRRWTGRDVVAIHHGFDHENFFRDRSPLPAEICRKLAPRGGPLRLLMVSHYNYYRNFETLLRALPQLRARLGGREVRLFLTCRLEPKANPGSYRTDEAAALLSRLGVTESVVQLGPLPYSQLHHLYGACDLYVAPAYAESFAHPLLEAMASGLPIVVSDLPVHREICGDAALYFPRFSPHDLAVEISRVAQSQDLTENLSASGRLRSRAFSWRRHADQIISLASSLVASEKDVRAA
jgi:glycosyltransferase involved in cell wall biosynthesis